MPRARRSTRLALIALMLVVLAVAAGSPPRVGDADSKPDPARFDPHYPDMKEWASAGVRGGIPPRDAAKVVRTLNPGDDVQAAIDAASKAGGGVVLLSPGTYPVRKALALRSNVVLRGQAKDLVVLENAMRSTKLASEHYAVRFDGVTRPG